jgi:two-component system phosphate regulon sensor histidine kinase PhoR
MLRSRFLWKLTAGYALCVVATALIVGALVAWRMERSAQQAIEARLAGESRLLEALATPRLLAGENGELQRLVRDAGREIGARLTVVRADGRVVADSAEDPAQMENHAQRPEILDARQRGTGTVRRLSRTVEVRMLYHARPIRGPQGELLGYARAALPASDLRSRLVDLRMTVLAGVVIATSIAVLLGHLLARQITRPVLALEAAAEAIAEGRYGPRLHLRSEDELGSLARSFNVMSQRLHETMSSLTADRGKLAAILSSMVEGVVAVDRDERVLHLNDVARHQLGVRAESVEGRPVWEVTRLREVPEVLAEAIRVEGPVHRVTEAPDARERSLELHASPLRGSGGGLDGAVVVIDDVTELHRLQTMRRDFVANVSHELKTPVTALQGLLETILDDTAVDATTSRRFLEKAREQAHRLSSLINDLLSLSRLESVGLVEGSELVDLRDPVEKAILSLLLAAERRRITVQRRLPPEPVTILGDAEALQDTVRNLLDNAIKYSPEGSTVSVGLRQSRDSAIIEVEDQGIGIEPRHQERIFERFYRVDKARSRELGGTGLGLAIVKHVVLRHGGAVSVESKPGEGSTFRILLPNTRSTAADT